MADARARALRKAMTHGEVKLWLRLRVNHGTAEGLARDRRHDPHFAIQGLRTLRFSLQEIDCNLDGVVETIYLALSAAPAAYPTRPRPPGEATLPAGGEG